MPAKKGRPPKKKKVTVTLTEEEFHVLAVKLGYADQDLIDGLAMGLIPPTANLDSPPTAILEVEGTRGSAEVVQPRPESGPIKEKRLSWADEVEEAEAQGNLAQESIPISTIEVPILTVDTTVGSDGNSAQAVAEIGSGAPVASDSVTAAKHASIGETKDKGNPRSWVDAVIGNISYGNVLNLQYIPLGDVVKFFEEEWDEGAKSWKFAVMVYLTNAKPTYMEMM